MSSQTIAPDRLHIASGLEQLTAYRFGTQAARHLFCRQCGIHPFVETRLNPGHYRVNLGCVEGPNALELPETVFDGKRL